MPFDLAFVGGLVLLVLAFPALVGAFSEGRPPRVAALLIIVGGGLVLWATTQNPIGYSFGEIPQVVVRVVADLVR